MAEEPYGQELILDLAECDIKKFTRESLQSYFIELCKLIDMQRCSVHFWDYQGVPGVEKQTNPKTVGVSAVQFILTSSIVIHTLPLLGKAYVNIFSCKTFNNKVAAGFTASWFGSKKWDMNSLIRK